MSATYAGSPRSNLDDLLSEEAVNHSWSYLERLRSYDPVYFNERWNGWIVTRYQDVVSGFRDDARLSSDRFAGPFAEEWQREDTEVPATLFKFLSSFFVWKDAPYHKRVRGLVSQAFAASSIEALRPRIAALTEHLLEPLVERESVDFIRDFAFHLPVIVITDYLGIPEDSRDRLKEWSDALGAVIFVRGGDEDRLERASRAVEELADYLRPLVRARQSDPKDDLLTALVHAREDNDWLEEDEVIANVILMVFAGHETTMNLLANAIVGFKRHPGEWERLFKHPELSRTASEEMLRYDGPIHANARWAKEPLVLGGKKIRKFDRVLLHQTAANHDPEVFQNPDRMDITRRPNRHVAFGQGVHTCLGGPLARLEAQEVFLNLTKRFERIEVETSELRYQPTIVSRSLQDLHVRFIPR